MIYTASKQKFVLVVSGDATEVNCAWPELLEICEGYGLVTDLIIDKDKDKGAP
jgi:hypothetical protein